MAGQGYVANIFQNRDIFTAYTADSGHMQLGNAVDAPARDSMTVMGKLSVNSTSNLPGQVPSLIKSFNHVGGATDIQASVGATRNNVLKTASNFVRDVKQAQAGASAAMKQAAGDLNVDLGKAQSTILPSQTTSHIGAAVGIAGDMMTGGAVALSMAAGQAIMELKQERGQLKPAQEQAVLDRMRQLLSPTRDEAGNVVKPAEIASDYDFENITNKELKELFLAPELHREGQQIFNMLHRLDHEIVPNVEDTLAREHHNEGGKLEAALEQGDQRQIANIVGEEAKANKIVEAVSEGQSLDVQPVETTYDYNAEGALFFASETATLTMKTNETPSLDQSAKDALLGLENEYRPVLDPQANLNLSMSAAI